MIEVSIPKAKYLECQSCSDIAEHTITITDSALADNEYGFATASQSFRLCNECAMDLRDKIIQNKTKVEL